MGFGSVGDTFRASCTVGIYTGFSVGIDLWNAPPPALLPRHGVLPPPPSLSLSPLRPFSFRTPSAFHAWIHVRARFVHTCVYAHVPSLFLASYGRGSETASLPPCASRRPYAGGVTASFGWVRAKETDENRAGMCETRSRERTGRGR